MKKPLKKTFQRFILLLSVFSALVAVCPAVLSQAILTPTPDADGNMFYTIKENDSLVSISMIMGVDAAQLRELNHLEGDTLVPGTRLLLGIYSTPTPTVGPSPTPTPITPTPTPFAGYAEVCVYLFEDENGNAIVGEYEPGIAGGAVNLSKRNGAESFSGLTTGLEPLCFQNVPEGDYNISVAPPAEYNPTTNMNYPLLVKAGDNTQVNFGAQKSAILEETVNIEDSGPKNPIMLLVGAAFLIFGAGILVVYGILKNKDNDEF